MIVWYLTCTLWWKWFLADIITQISLENRPKKARTLIGKTRVCMTQASRVSGFRLLGNAFWDRRSRKVSTNPRISAITAWIFVSAFASVYLSSCLISLPLIHLLPIVINYIRLKFQATVSGSFWGKKNYKIHLTL